VTRLATLLMNAIVFCMKPFAIFLATLALALAAPAFAKQYDSQFKDWSVYTHEGSCYIVSAPTKQNGNYNRRGEPYLLITTKRGGTDEINASSGYPYKTNSEVTMTLDGRTHKLFTQGEHAWAYDTQQDAMLIRSMKAGSSLKLRGTSQRGTWSEDTYSLMGISAAYDRMKALCK
jgi:hypothetical protein